MGNAVSNAREDDAFAYIQILPFIGPLYAALRSAVYHAKGNSVQVRRSSISVLQGLLATVICFTPGATVSRAVAASVACGRLLERMYPNMDENVEDTCIIPLEMQYTAMSMAYTDILLLYMKEDIVTPLRRLICTRFYRLKSLPRRQCLKGLRNILMASLALYTLHSLRQARTDTSRLQAEMEGLRALCTRIPGDGQSDEGDPLAASAQSGADAVLSPNDDHPITEPAEEDYTGPAVRTDNDNIVTAGPRNDCTQDDRAI